MKKIFTSLITVLMLFAFSSLAYAQEDIEISSLEENLFDEISLEPSQNLVRDLDNKRGAEIRVLQLVRNIQTNIESGEDLIDRFKENNYSEIDYERLYGLLNKLELIVIELENFNFNVSNSEMARQFVFHRQEAIQVTREFRLYVTSVLSEDEIENYRTIVNQRRLEVHQQFEDRIQNQKQVYSQEQFFNLVRRFDVEGGEDLIERVISEEISLIEGRQELARLISSMNQERRDQRIQEIRELRTRENIQIRERVHSLNEIVRERIGSEIPNVQERVDRNLHLIETRVMERGSRVVENVRQNVNIESERERIIAELRERRSDTLNNSNESTSIRVRGESVLE